VGGLGGGEGAGLEQELIDTDQTDDVTGGAVLDGLDRTTHHEHGALDRLDGQVGLGSGLVVGALDADLGPGLDGAGEDTAERVEAALVGGRHHLGDVEHERALGIAVADTDGRLVVHGALVQGFDTVALGSLGGGEVEDDHLEEGVTSGQELLHDGLCARGQELRNTKADVP
jgi:hypothetical protein